MAPTATGTTGTAGSALPAVGGTSMSGLADWASPYITDYLGKAQALGTLRIRSRYGLYRIYQRQWSHCRNR